MTDTPTIHTYFLDKQRHLSESPFLDTSDVLRRSPRQNCDMLLVDEATGIGELVEAGRRISFPAAPLHFVTQPKWQKVPR